MMDQLCETYITTCGDLAKMERELEVAFDLYDRGKLSWEAYDKISHDLDQRFDEIMLVIATLKDVLKDAKKEKVDADSALG